MWDQQNDMKLRNQKNSVAQRGKTIFWRGKTIFWRGPGVVHRGPPHPPLPHSGQLFNDPVLF